MHDDRWDAMLEKRILARNDGRTSDALELSRQMTGCAPKNPVGFICLAEDCIELSLMSDARKAIAAALTLDSDSQRAIYLAMHVERATGHYHRALEWAQRLSHLLPLDYGIHVHLAAHSFECGYYGEAHQYIERLLHIDAANIVGERLRHDLARLTGQAYGACFLSHQLTRHPNSNADDFLRFAFDQLIIGDCAGAEKTLEQAIVLYNDNRELYLLGFYIADVRGDEKRGCEWAAKTLKTCPDATKDSEVRQQLSVYFSLSNLSPIEIMERFGVETSAPPTVEVATDRQDLRTQARQMRWRELTASFARPEAQYSPHSEYARCEVLEEIVNRLRMWSIGVSEVRPELQLAYQLNGVVWTLQGRELQEYKEAIGVALRTWVISRHPELMSFQEAIALMSALKSVESADLGLFEKYLKDNFEKLDEQDLCYLHPNNRQLYRMFHYNRCRSGSGAPGTSRTENTLNWIYNCRTYRHSRVDRHRRNLLPNPLNLGGIERLDVPGRPYLGRSLRVAICISGQLRNFRAAAEQWRDVRFLRDDYDVFVSTWRSIGAKVFSADQSFRHFDPAMAVKVASYVVRYGEQAFLQNLPNTLKSRLLEPTTIVTADDLSKVYKPVRIKIEDEPTDVDRVYSNSEKMYYKIQDCWNLAAEENIDQYDLVVRVRPDKGMVGQPASWAEQAMEIINGNRVILSARANSVEPHLHPVSGLVMGDMFAAGAPDVMRVYSHTFDYFNRMPADQRRTFPAVLQGHWPLSNNLKEEGILVVGTGWTGDQTVNFPLIARDEFREAVGSTADSAFMAFFFTD